MVRMWTWALRISLLGLSITVLSCDKSTTDQAQELVPVPPRPIAGQQQPNLQEKDPAPIQPQTAVASQQYTTPQVVAVPISDNLLVNSSFETTEGNGKLAGWVGPEADITLVQDETFKDHGAVSVRIQAPNNLNLAISQFVQAKGGKTYRLSGSVAKENITGSAVLGVGIAADQDFPGFVSNSAAAADGKKWTRLSVDFKVPDAADGLPIHISLRCIPGPDSTDALGQLWYDNYSLYETAIPLTPNLVANGSFESANFGSQESDGASASRLPNWVRVPDANISVDDETYVDGKQSLKVEESSADANLSIEQLVTLEPRSQYVLTGSLKTMNLIGEACLAIAIVPKDGADAKISNGIRISGTTDWNQYILPIDTSDLNGPTQFIISLRKIGATDDKSAGGTVWFDNYQLYKVPDA